MHYISTRGEAPAASFFDAMTAGLARDGGLYVPDVVPSLDAATIAGFAGRPYAEVAEAVIAPFAADAFAPDDLREMIAGAYRSFRHPAVTPLVQLETNLFVLELFHGPTLAFKDVAMQLLGRMMDRALGRKGERAVVVGATSGDTGAAAVEAFRGLPQVDVVILYPHGRVSDVQRRQMTSVPDANIHAIAVEGSFDDCQSIVKAMFNHHEFRDAVQLTGVNSINWARIVAQITYYFVAAVALGGPHRPVSFTVPTGNFGDIFAGHVAKRMGLPIDRLVIATNENDILQRCLADGDYALRDVAQTQSPSMDIQISSNFERALFDALGRDAATLRGLMGGLRQGGHFSVPPQALAQLRGEFDAFRTDEVETADEMRRTYRETGHILDPHTAVGVHAARRALAQEGGSSPMVVLGTAHPAKFPDAVVRATGQHPALPPHMADLMHRPERFTVLPNDVAAVQRFIRERAGAAA
ncbi:threonine synthase [Lichenihabitans sp. Uapishka_5]|uniref:threonine synthase n=1 Tax=Lichenihabitans sp. Uapishka_5 TaxID=3037302 RepID=UPI0029E8041B|nr:threonine synthase [Lichenihabitans sp. Uapishka_5]MDX7949755.1 threonine synthase [Lichenihabitans sp. Uapishka_5]